MARSEDLEEESKKENKKKLAEIFRRASEKIEKGEQNSKEEKMALKVIEITILSGYFNERDTKDLREKLYLLQAVGHGMYNHYKLLAQEGYYEKIPIEIEMDRGKHIAVREYFQKRYRQNDIAN